MRDRLLRVGVLVVVLLAINAIARLVTRFAYGDGTAEHEAARETMIWIGWGALALVLAVTAGWWSRQRPVGEMARELAVAVGVAGLLYVSVGPFLSEPPRFVGGISDSIVELAFYLVVAGVGGLVGALVVIAVGGDYTSQQLKLYEEARSTKPRRAIRG